MSLVGILGLVRIAATLAAGFRLGGIADFGSVDPQWLEGLSTSPIFTDLSSRYRPAEIPDRLTAPFPRKIGLFNSPVLRYNGGKFSEQGVTL